MKTTEERARRAAETLLALANETEGVVDCRAVDKDGKPLLIMRARAGETVEQVLARWDRIKPR